MKTKNKPCKRNKCPYYITYFKRCEYCEWNPDRVWADVRKKVKS